MSFYFRVKVRISFPFLFTSNRYTQGPPNDAVGWKLFSRLMNEDDCSRLVSAIISTSLTVVQPEDQDLDQYFTRLHADDKASVDALVSVADFLYGVFGFFKVLSRNASLPPTLFVRDFYIVLFDAISLSVRATEFPNSIFPAFQRMRTCALLLLQNMAILKQDVLLTSLLSAVTPQMCEGRYQALYTCASRSVLPYYPPVVSQKTKKYPLKEIPNIEALSVLATGKNNVFALKDGCATLRALLFLNVYANFAEGAVAQGIMNACFIFFLQATGREDICTSADGLPLNLGYGRTFDLDRFTSTSTEGEQCREAVREALRTLQMVALHVPATALFNSVNTQLAFDFFGRLSAVLTLPGWYTQNNKLSSIDGVDADDASVEFPDYDLFNSPILMEGLSALKASIPPSSALLPQSGTPDLYPVLPSWEAADASCGGIGKTNVDIDTSCFASFKATPGNPCSCSVFEACLFAMKCIGFCPVEHAPLLCASPGFSQGVFTLLATLVTYIVPASATSGSPSSLRGRGGSNDELSDLGSLVFSGLATLIRSVPGLRMYIAARIFGPLLDTKLYPAGGESGDKMIPVGATSEKILDHDNNQTLRARILCLLLHPNVEIAQGVGQMVFALAGDDADEFTRLAGLGRAAGVLAASGIPAFAQLAAQSSIDIDTILDAKKKQDDENVGN